MRKISVLLFLCVVALSLAGCGGIGSSSGTAELSFEGKKYLFKKVEFAVEVNPDMMRNTIRTIEKGKPQPIRFSLRTEMWSKLWDGKAFVIAWWRDGDNPMELLKGFVGQELTNDQYQADNIYVNFLLDGKSIEVDSNYRSWIIIENVEEETVSGKFGGTFKVQDGKTFKTIGATTIEEGSFSAPLKINFKEK